MSDQLEIPTSEKRGEVLDQAMLSALRAHAKSIGESVFDAIPDHELLLGIRKNSQSVDEKLRAVVRGRLFFLAYSEDGSLPTLRKLSQDASPSVRAAVAESIWEIHFDYLTRQESCDLILIDPVTDLWGISEGGTQLLKTLAQDEVKVVRDLSVKWLLASDLEELVWIGDLAVSQSVVEHLAHLDPLRIRGQKEFCLLQELTLHPNAEFRKMVARSLWDAQGKWMDLLLTLAQDENPEVREEAVRSLSSQSEWSLHAYEQIAQSKFADQRADMAGSLGELHGVTTLPILEGLAKDDDAQVRFHVLGSCKALGLSALPVVEMLAKDESVSVRARAAEVLGDMGLNALPTLILLSEDRGVEHGPVRTAATRSLGEMGMPAYQVLVRLTQDDDQDVRAEAAKSLGCLGKAAFPALQSLAMDSHELVRAAVAQSLRWIGMDALPTLEVLGRDESTKVRSAVAGVLGTLGIGALPMLQTFATDSEREVRLAATISLSLLGEEACPILEQLSRDEDQTVRGIASDAHGKGEGGWSRRIGYYRDNVHLKTVTKIERILNSLRWKYLKAISLSPSLRNAPLQAVSPEFNGAFLGLLGLDDTPGCWEDRGFDLRAKQELNWEDELDALAEVLTGFSGSVFRSSDYADVIALKPGFHEAWCHEDFPEELDEDPDSPRGRVFSMLRGGNLGLPELNSDPEDILDPKAFLSYAPCAITEGPFHRIRDDGIPYYYDLMHVGKITDQAERQKTLLESFKVLDYRTRLQEDNSPETLDRILAEAESFLIWPHGHRGF